MTRVGIVGLGVMGSAVADHLLQAGFEVGGYDVDADKVAALVAGGGRADASATETAARSDIVLFWLPSVASLEQATEAVAAGAHPGLVVIEMGTLPLDAKQRARGRLAASGVDCIDAPVSGTGRQAEDATLVIFASGSAEAYEKALAVFEAIGRRSYHLGPFGNGSVMKYIANLLVTVHTLAAAEAHVLGITAGLDPDLVQQVMSDGVGGSKMFDIRGPMMAADRYEPPAGRLDIILKDATIIKDYAGRQKAPTPLLDTALAVYRKASEEGLGDLDAAAVCRYLEDSAGIRRS